MKLSPNAPCPCGTGRKLKKCCRPILNGQAAQSPEALMRSRYTAYATGNIQHIIQTTHPNSPHHQPDTTAWAKEIAHFCQHTEFVGLCVLESKTQDAQGWVKFTAQLQQGGHQTEMTEHSEFAKVNGRWLYIEAAPEPPATQSS